MQPYAMSNASRAGCRRLASPPARFKTTTASVRELTEAALNIASRLSRDEIWELVKREIRTATARPSRSTATLADSALKILVHRSPRLASSWRLHAALAAIAA